MQTEYDLTAVASQCKIKGIPRAIAQYSHPGDAFLFLVLIEQDHNFVIWTYNAQVTGFSDGHYFHFYPDIFFGRPDRRHAFSEALACYKYRLGLYCH